MLMPVAHLRKSGVSSFEFGVAKRRSFGFVVVWRQELRQRTRLPCAPIYSNRHYATTTSCIDKQSSQNRSHFLDNTRIDVSNKINSRIPSISNKDYTGATASQSSSLLRFPILFLGCGSGIFGFSCVVKKKRFRCENSCNEMFVARRSFSTDDHRYSGARNSTTKNEGIDGKKNTTMSSSKGQGAYIEAISPAGKMRRPTVFGTSILGLVEDLSDGNEEDFTDIPRQRSDREDCPICRKYSQGPCGEIFKKWLKCTDECEGMINEATGEELHLIKCEHFANQLASCLEKNEEFYAKAQVITDHDFHDPKLINQWETIIKDLEMERQSATKPFPSQSMCPRMEVNPYKTVGLAVFFIAPASTRHKLNSSSSNTPVDLIVAYVKDDSGNLLAAGTAADMEEQIDLFDGGYALSFNLDSKVRSVTAFAIYDGISGTDNVQPIYSKKMSLR